VASERDPDELAGEPVRLLGHRGRREPLADPFGRLLVVPFFFPLVRIFFPRRIDGPHSVTAAAAAKTTSPTKIAIVATGELSSFVGPGAVVAVVSRATAT
jgi:hypothetical protein